MNTNYKFEISDEILEEQLQQMKLHAANRVKKSKPPPIPPPLPPQSQSQSQSHLQSQSAIIDPMRSRSDSVATSIYVIGGNTNISNPPTIDRRQQHRLSWVNMRRYGDDGEDLTSVVTPSPQTTRSFISTITTNMDVQLTSPDGLGGQVARLGSNVSGRTTATSGCMSSSGITTISGSNNTLNDAHANYSNHTSSHNDRDYHNFSRIEASNGRVRGGPKAAAADIMKNLNSSESFNLTIGSTAKLITNADDEANQQTKCSVFRGLVLCTCLNITYGNVVRFPRELDKYGLAYLIPYVILLLLVGLPTVLLEISVGQFLGQGAAHTWRASPIFKGACIISRFASWISTVWVSLHAVIAMAYIGMFNYNSMPFKECVGNLRISLDGYTLTNNSGQECLQKTFLTSFWENPFYFGIISIALIVFWLLVMLGTHNGRFVRRILFIGGLLGLLLLCSLTGWEVHNSLNQLQPYFPQLWPFSADYLADSNIWFSALMQITFSLNCGFGILPTLTGKFLYKGDTVRTTFVYMCFNLLINALAVTLFMVQFDHSANGGDMIEELKPLTAIYDRILYDKTQQQSQLQQHQLWMKVVLPSMIYVLVIISSFLSVIMAIYTATRLVPRHPNYIISLVALVASVICFSAPRFYIARLLDGRVVGTLVISALVFKLIALTWIYGAKNVYTDLEFSIGRPIFKGWMCLWCICPAILTALLVWWCSDDDQYDVLPDVMPRWAPILFVLFVIMFIACIQIFRQVEYNFFGMICEASKSAKEWGPADPLARHAWKQWRSVCQDTGRKDFTLRRRGTRDYTHSIKKGQYSTASLKYGSQRHNPQQIIQQSQQQNQQLQQQQLQQWKSGNSSPNYSGSVFGDSAIEEDISVDKFPGVTQQQQQQQPYVPFSNTVHNNNDGKPLRYPHRTRMEQQPQQQRTAAQQSNHIELNTNHTPQHSTHHDNKHREIVYIRRLSSDEEHAHATRIEITPSNESITYKGIRNPLARVDSNTQPTNYNYIKRTYSSDRIDNHRNSNGLMVGSTSNGGIKLLPNRGNETNADEHICWRKFTMNPEEYSTEL